MSDFGFKLALTVSLWGVYLLVVCGILRGGWWFAGYYVRAVSAKYSRKQLFLSITSGPVVFAVISAIVMTCLVWESL